MRLTVSVSVIGAQVDPTDIVRETSETDNMAFLSTIVRFPADLQLTGRLTKSDFSGKFDHDRGEFTMVELRFTVRNTGPGVSKPTVIATSGRELVFTPGNFSFRTLGVLCNGGVIIVYGGIGRSASVQCGGPNTTCFFECNVPGLTPGTSVVIVAQGYIRKSVLGEFTIEQQSVTFRSTLNPSGEIFGDLGGNNGVSFTTTLP